MHKASSFLIKIWALGFGVSLAVIALTEIIPAGGWPEGILFYIGLLFFFPANIFGMAILKTFWDPNYVTPDGMPVTFWILSVCINWIVLLFLLFLMLKLLTWRNIQIAGKTTPTKNNKIRTIRSEWLPASRLVLTPLRSVWAGVTPRAAIGDRGRSAKNI